MTNTFKTPTEREVERLAAELMQRDRRLTKEQAIARIWSKSPRRYLRHLREHEQRLRSQGRI